MRVSGPGCSETKPRPEGAPAATAVTAPAPPAPPDPSEPPSLSSPAETARAAAHEDAPDHAAPIHACLGTSLPRSQARPPWGAGKCHGPRVRRHPARHTPRSVLMFKSLPQWSTWRQARPAKRYKFFAEMELNAGPSRRKSERCGPTFTVFQHRSDFEFASVSRGEGSAPWAEARPAAVPW